MTSQQLKEYCEAEFENIDRVVSELFSVVNAKEEEFTIVELAAIATFLHNFYNGIGNILKRVLFFKQIDVQDTPTWHKDLLKTSSDIGIITTDLYNTLSGYLSFRHFFVHAYTFTLKWVDMKPLVRGVEETLKQFKYEIYGYVDKSE